MRLFKSGLLCVLHLSIISTACGQVGKVTVVVTDYETGNPISGADARVGFDQYVGWVAGPENISQCNTDLDGRCTMWGHGNGTSVGIAVMSSAEYYGASKEFRFKGSLSPIATPWNPTIQLRLKKKKNPIPMYAMRLSKHLPKALCIQAYDKKTGKYIEGPAGTVTVAWDLEEGDWVKPDGKGEIADFIFTIHRPARKVYLDSWGHEHIKGRTTLKVTVSNDGDGFIPYPVPKEDRNGGPWLPYLAPEDGYGPWESWEERPKEFRTADMNYFFRVRTIKDETGKIISANYGKIYGDFRITMLGNAISFTYYFNPTPNDRNVEFRPGANLFTDLRGTRDPYEP